MGSHCLRGALVHGERGGIVGFLESAKRTAAWSLGASFPHWSKMATVEQQLSDPIQQE